jgi:hypothetical protein
MLDNGLSSRPAVVNKSFKKLLEKPSALCGGGAPLRG